MSYIDSKDNYVTTTTVKGNITVHPQRNCVEISSGKIRMISIKDAAISEIKAQPFF